MPHSAQLLREIERAVSRERLKRYLAATAQNLGDAVSLYEQNAALSEMTFGLLHCLEITVRNSMHDRLSAHFGTPRWFRVAPLSTYSQDKINAAIHDAGGPTASPGKVVAELMFGFWTDLTAQRYHWSLWQPCLRAAFPHVRLARPLIMTPQNAAFETERLIAAALFHRKPVYMAFPADCVNLPVVGTAQQVPAPASDQTTLEQATEAIATTIAGAICPPPPRRCRSRHTKFRPT